MNAKDLKRAILVCALQPIGSRKLDMNENAMRFVCELAGAMKVYGDAEIVAALREVACLPAEGPKT